MGRWRKIFRGSLGVLGLLVLLVLTTNAPGYCPAIEVDTPERNTRGAWPTQADAAAHRMPTWQWEFATDSQQTLWEPVLLR